ncbi:THAP domain-containing 9 [Paramuricea clavata]|uniref:THAP domain-containing 9, partial n=1 Tax=Paramuricea clavata TaxID=317549 RepID=A0A6S7FMZ6_PARCT|nr:THAP domain-containing 9 [Paramuricea clavata]
MFFKVKNGGRYSNETKSFALSLYHLSGKSYKMVSKLFCLPSKLSILKWISKMPNGAELTQPSLDVITTKVQACSSTGKLCIILMDEISLKSHLFYDCSKDKVLGLEDLGDEITSHKLATSAIVLMARGIIENWKQPPACYLVNESCSSDIVKEKLTDAITKLENIGLNVLGVGSDIGSNFQKFVREMGITPENPWFIHNSKKILYIFDAPHIIKAIWNNLTNYNFHFDNKVASWNDVEALYKIDIQNSIRCCPKLTNKHMHPNGFLKMKVKLATQVLSHSVAAALMMAISGGLLPTSASGTAELVSHFDDIFDCLNSSTFSTPKECNRPMTASSKHMQTMKEKLQFIKKIKVIDAAKNKDVTSSLKCVNALQITLRSTMELWKTVQAVKNSKAAKIDSNVASKEEKENSSVQPMLFHEIQDVDYKSSTIEENLISNNATCGYLLKRCLEKHSCQTCSSALIKMNLIVPTNCYVISRPMKQADNHLEDLLCLMMPSYNTF